MNSWIFVVYAGILGAAIGSFLGASVYRIPRKVPLDGRSHCPSCGVKLRWYDNIPIFSWLILRGKSRCCNTKISVHYLLYEISAFVIGALVGYFLGIIVAFGVALAVVLITFLWSKITLRSVNKS